MEIHTITGAFGYSGKYIAQRLLDRGLNVKTLTNSPNRGNSFNGEIEVAPLCFDDLEALTLSLKGTTVLYNTYWVRFNHKSFSHKDAVSNTLKLFEAAKRAGVKRIVHVSITNPDINSDLEYFSGKGELEQALQSLGVSYSILRPAVLFGHEDILVNNIAWALRRFPVFGVFGNGQYRLQPIHVDDLAELAVKQGASTNNSVINAIGPESFTYFELVKMIGETIGRARPVVSLPPGIAYLISRVIGAFVGDIFVTREEIAGLMADLLYVEGAEPTGTIKLSNWARENSQTLGVRYASELGRRRDRKTAYVSI